MTTPVTKLVKGTRTLDLQNGRYYMGRDFNPPPYLATPLFAEGTSANQSGASKVDETPVNRSFTFTVNIRGSSDAEVHRALADLQSFLTIAGDENEPLYFAFHPNSDTPEPLWGNYGVWLRYEVVHGKASVSNYSIGSRMTRNVDALVELTVKPFAVGKRQRLASAMGRIAECVYGASDGVSRGLHVSPSLTNKMTNPVFGNSTWNTGWTADASLTASQNTDAAYVLAGAINSARLISRSTGQEFYQSINAGNTNTHSFVAYIMLPDLGTPSSSDCELYYNTTLTTTFTSLGNGLWRLTATAAGINAATNTGVQVKNGRAVYLLYYGMIEGNNGINYEPIWGDQLGCAWSGTVHASTSTSTAGRVRVPMAADTFDYQQGALRIVWTPPMIYSAFSSANYYLFDAGNFIVFFDATNDVFTFYDGSSSASRATTFAADTPIVIHCVWGPSGKSIYVNGVETSATYTMPAAASYFYIGSSSTPSLWAGGVLGDCAVWGQALTDAQVANDYANVSQLTADNQRVGCIPWLWTKDGDDVVDNCDDSTRDNWCVCGGVPGSAEAITYLDMRSGQAWGGLNNRGLYFSRLASNYFFPPSELYGELSGTVDASYSGGAYESTSITTTTGAWTKAISMTRRLADLLAGREFAMLSYFYDGGADIKIGFTLAYGIDNPMASRLKTYAATGGATIHRITETLIAPALDKSITAFASQAGLYLYARRLSGGAVNAIADFYQLFFRPFALIKQDSSSSLDKGIIYDSLDNSVTLYNVTSGYPVTASVDFLGDTVELAPSRINQMVFAQGYGGGASDVAWTLTIYRAYITPRYQLL